MADSSPPTPPAGDDLAVVIPTRGRPDILRRTLDALAAQTVTGFEVVVVVDGREQPEPDHPLARVVTVDHGGPGAARNRGTAATRRPLVLYLGDDMIPEPTLVEAHLAAHARHPEQTAAVLGHVDWHPEVAGGRIHEWLDWSATQFDYEQLAGQAGEDVGSGRFYSCNVSLKRSLLERVGGFDEDFIFYYEDLDLGSRLAEAGMTLRYAPEARALHLHDYTLEAVRRRFEGIALGERLMADKHPWFEPFFHRRIQGAANSPRARRRWTWIVGLLPRGTAPRRYAEQLANRWYHQQVADAFLDAWERAAEVVELRRYLGERFDATLLIHHARAVGEEADGIGDELEFYRTSEAYLYDLTAFSMSRTKEPYHEQLRRLVPAGGSLLDYGCGIGSDGLRLAEQGHEVHFADFDNPSTRYLRWRLEQRGLDLPVYDVERDEIPGSFDAAYAFDVVEHVDDPVAFLEQLEARAEVVAVNLLEDDPHDHEHALHRTLPIEELVDRARSRGLLSYTLHHGRSHLVVYRGSPAAVRSGPGPR